MNDKSIPELKKTRMFLHRMSLSLIVLFMFSLVLFLFTWCFTSNVLVPFVSLLMTIVSLILFAIYILKRDIWSVLICIKEVTDEETKT